MTLRAHVAPEVYELNTLASRYRPGSRWYTSLTVHDGSVIGPPVGGAGVSKDDPGPKASWGSMPRRSLGAAGSEAYPHTLVELAPLAVTVAGPIEHEPSARM